MSGSPVLPDSDPTSGAAWSISVRPSGTTTTMLTRPTPAGRDGARMLLTRLRAHRRDAHILVLPMSLALSGRDLLSVADLGRDEIDAVLDLAVRAKQGGDLGTPLRGLNMALIFQRPSNRTRVSFEVAINRLGGHPIALFGDEIRLGERETASDIARILDRYADGVIARLVSQRDLVAIAAAVRGPVISAMTDAEHPCQLLADLMTVREVTGRIAGARVVYIGDGNNVCTSWVYAAAICGVDPVSYTHLTLPT